MKNNLAPFEVAEYSPDFITNVIRYVTRWSSRGEVLDKFHIAYLKNYLAKLQVKTVVFESDYVDRHYLEDYSEYYARCFQSLPKTCARLHFFTTEFDEEELASALNEIDQDFIRGKITKTGAYVGFVVIRPLPVTCIARMCLLPYELGEKAILLKDDVNVSFFGIELTLKTAAFIEQDKVVSACATSAIWALLNSNRSFRPGQLPSPSAITKSALAADKSGVRTFPAAGGLKIEHVCRSLKTYGLEPSVIYFDEFEPHQRVNFIKQVLAAYIPGNIPVLIGGSVNHIHENGEEEYLGEHLICALGYKSTQSKEATLPASHISRVYVHDDRYGPYVSLESQSDGSAFSFELLQDEEGGAKPLRKESFAPKVLFLGLNHKVRIEYEHAYNVSAAISELAKNVVEQPSTPEQMTKDLSSLSKCDFRVELNYSADIKKEFLSRTNSFYSFNGTCEPSAFLTANMPKYLWRCRFILAGDLFADILIDATGVPQGDLVIGSIAYTTDADICWRALGRLIPTQYYRQITAELEQSVSGVIGCVTRFFQNYEDNYLDANYGPLRVPARKYRPTEIDESGEQIRRVDIVKIVRGSNAATQIEKLKKEILQIWVIDQFGDLIIGDEPTTSDRMGHPALTGGGAARLGGELKYLTEESVWEINTASRTYSAHLRKDPEKADRYLDSVIAQNLAGCPVRKAPIRMAETAQKQTAQAA